MNWTTRDGRVIPIKDMTISHLTNTIAYLERNAGQMRGAEATAICSAMAFAQGEMATYALDQALSELADSEYDDSLTWLQEKPVYRALKKELRRKTRQPQERHVREPSSYWIPF